MINRTAFGLEEFEEPDNNKFYRQLQKRFNDAQGKITLVAFGIPKREQGNPSLVYSIGAIIVTINQTRHWALLKVNADTIETARNTTNLFQLATRIKLRFAGTK